MADALDSKSSNRKVVGVQVPAPVFWVPDNYSVDQAVKWIDAVELQLHDLVLNHERFGYASENGLFSYPLHQMLVSMGKRRSY